jgi:hypothetical protein
MEQRRKIKGYNYNARQQVYGKTCRQKTNISKVKLCGNTRKTNVTVKEISQRTQ